MITYLLTVAAAILLPIVPAWLLYRSLPSTAAVGGPFQGLNIQLTGAFAGYFLVLLSVLWYIDANPVPNYEVWKIEGVIQLEDSDARREVSLLVIPPDAPTPRQGGVMSIEVPIGLNRRSGKLEYPHLVIERPGFKHATFDLGKSSYSYGRGQEYEIDRNIIDKVITIEPPIELVPLQEGDDR